jgi:hypothetical protein
MSNWKISVAVVSLLVFLALAPSAYGDEETVYLYSGAVSSLVDVGKYLSTGEVHLLMGRPFRDLTSPGPAPDPYPHIHVWEEGFEHLGSSPVEMDGIYFINPGHWWQKNQWVLVLWSLRVPNASERLASDFDHDLTLSLWADWDLDEKWDKNERIIRNDINIQDRFPTSHQTLRVYYLSIFRIPDIDALRAACWGSGAKKGIKEVWVRGAVSYAEPQVSPDGEQLFGDVEDYLVKYKGRSGKKDKKG